MILLNKILLRVFWWLFAFASAIFLAIFAYNQYISFSLKQEVHDLQQLKIKNSLMPKGGDGKNPAILLIHGFGGSPTDLQPIINDLTNRHIAFEAILLEGHGKNPSDLMYTNYWQWLHQSSLAFDKVKMRFRQLILPGVTMFDIIARSLSTQKDVNKLIVISPFFQITKKWYYFGTIESWSQRFSSIIPYVKKLKIGQINDPKGLAKYIAYQYLPLKAIGQLHQIGEIATYKCSEVNQHILWFHSTSDNVSDYNQSFQAFNTLASNNKTFIKYSKSNHILLFDYDSQDVINHINKFIAEDYLE